MQCGGDGRVDVSDGRVDEVLTLCNVEVTGGWMCLDGRVDEVLTLCNVEVTGGWMCLMGGWMRYSPCAMWG